MNGSEELIGKCCETEFASEWSREKCQTHRHIYVFEVRGYKWEPYTIFSINKFLILLLILIHQL